MINIIEKNFKPCNNLIAFGKDQLKSKTFAKTLQKFHKQGIIKAKCSVFQQNLSRKCERKYFKNKLLNFRIIKFYDQAYS